MFPRPFSATTRTDFASRVSLLSCAQRTTTACPAIICSGARWRATGSAVPAERMDISSRLRTGKEPDPERGSAAARACRSDRLRTAPARDRGLSLHRDLQGLPLPVPCRSRQHRGRYSAPRTTALIIFAMRVPENTSSVSAPPRAVKPATASLPRSFSVSRSPPPRSASAFRPCRATF